MNKKHHAHEKRKQKSPPKSPSDEKAKTPSQFPATNANADDDMPSEKQPHFDEGNVNIPKHKTETEYVEETRQRNVPVGAEESHFNGQKANNEQPIGRENEANEHRHRHRSASNSPKFHHRAGTDAREHEQKRAQQTENNPKKVRF